MRMKLHTLNTSWTEAIVRLFVKIMTDVTFSPILLMNMEIKETASYTGIVTILLIESAMTV